MNPFSESGSPLGQLSQWDRRLFLKTALGAGLALAWAKPGSLLADDATPPSNQIRVAIIGIGAEGRVLIDAMLKIPGVRFVAVCDIWDYARTYGERYLKKNGHEVNAYQDYHDLLEKEKDLQAVIVATPDFWHAPITNDCLKAGLHVYCEKMMSNTLEGARSMVRTMRETGKLLQIGHQRRSNPRYLVALNHLLGDAKLLGQLTAINGQWNRAVSDDLGWPKKAVIPDDVLKKYGYEDMHQFRNWRWFRHLGGGPLSDLGAHQIDVFNWFMGRAPDTVIASGGMDYYPNHEWFDNAMAIFEYKQPTGKTVRAFYQVQTTTSAGGGYFEQFMGTEGTLRMSENPKYTAIYREARAPSWDQWLNLHYIAADNAPAPADGDKVDARETAELAAYTMPIVLTKAIHQPHLENFFLAIQGKAKLNCPADEALASEIAIFKASEAVDARKLIDILPADGQA